MAKLEFKPFAAALNQRLSRNVDNALLDVGLRIEADAVQSIQDGGIPAPNHVVSAPGNPPNADTHTLDRSVRSEAVIQHSVRVTATAPYSAHLEWGTKFMAPRPYMRPALYKNREFAEAAIAQAVKQAVKG